MTDAAQVSAEWAERGFTFGSWSDAPGAEWPNFTYSVDELFMVVEGEVELELQDRTMRLRAGEEVLIPAGVKRTKRILGQQYTRWYFGYRRYGRDQVAVQQPPGPVN